MILPKALIFDVDGTLADNERDGHRVAFNQAFDQLGFDWCWSESFYGSLLAVGGGKERIRHFIEPNRDLLPEDFQSSEALTQLIVDLHRAKTSFYRQRLTEGAIPLRPGVLRLLEEAREAGVRLAIATTSALPAAMALLEQTLPEGAADWFEVIAAGDVVPAKKPAPDIYCYALDKLGLMATDCVAIEDSPAGAKAAMAAGLATVVTVNGYTAQGDFSGASLVLSDLGEPEQPFKAISGEAILREARQTGYVDVALLEGLLLQSSLSALR